MKVVPDSIHKGYVMLKKVAIQQKSNLVLLQNTVSRAALGRVIHGEMAGKIVMYLVYDQIEVDELLQKVLLVPVQHILCEIEPEEFEDVTEISKYEPKPEPWLNMPGK